MADDPKWSAGRETDQAPCPGRRFDLTVRAVDFALGNLAKQLSTRSVRLARMILIQAIRKAMVNDLVVRNVADLAAVPMGRPGRPVRLPSP
jgi:hypothetical protein